MVGQVGLGMVWYGKRPGKWYTAEYLWEVEHRLFNNYRYPVSRSTSSAGVYMHLYLAATTYFEPLMAVCEDKVQVQRNLNIPNNNICSRTKFIENALRETIRTIYYFRTLIIIFLIQTANSNEHTVKAMGYMDTLINS